MQLDPVVLNSCANAEDTAAFLTKIVKRLNELGINATYIPRDDRINPNCGVRYNDGTKDVAIAGVGDCMTYDNMAKLERMVECTYVQQRLNELQLRMAQVGWRAYVQNGLVHIEQTDTGSAEIEFDPTYEKLYELENSLQRAQMRHAVLYHRAQWYLSGGSSDARISIEDDGVRVSTTRETVTVRYNDPTALAKLDRALAQISPS